MALIQGGRWDGMLRRLFPVKDTSIAPEIAAELQPVIQVQDFEPEMYLLRGEHLTAGRSEFNATPGNFPFVQLLNPAGSQVLAIVRRITYNYIAAAGPQTTRLLTGNNTLGADTLNTSRMDLRIGRGLPHETACEIRSGQTAGILSNPLQQNFAEGVAVQEFVTPWILPPGTSIVVAGGTSDTHLEVNYSWRERTFNPAENAF